MEKIKSLFVSIKFSDKEIELGELVLDDRDIYFRYYPNFIDLNLELSPFKLPLNSDLHKAELIPFEGLFGIFNDSLPDGWGRLLLDRKLLAKGVLPGDIGPLDRLAYVGQNGMGALIYKPEISSPTSSNNILDLDTLANEMEEVYEGSSPEIIDKLFGLGGSSGGARPKIFVGYNRYSDHLIFGENQLPEDYHHWIIKFQSSTDFQDIANIEYAYYKMALDAGINMSESRLFTGASGKKYFGTKRFDRIGNNRIHMHSASGLLHDDFRRSNMDYGHLMDAGFNLIKDIQVYEDVLRLAAFNIYSHNRDDHSKNFSFLMDSKGIWSIAPAYDLTFSSSSHGMHSTMIAGESESPGAKNLIELAEDFGVKNIHEIIEQVKDVCANWIQYANDAGVRNDSSSLIHNKINNLIKN